MTDTVILDALAAQAATLIDRAPVTDETLRTLLGDPGDTHDPRRWLVNLAFGEFNDVIDGIHKAAADETRADELTTEWERVAVATWRQLNDPHVPRRELSEERTDDEEWDTVATWLEDAV